MHASSTEDTQRSAARSHLNSTLDSKLVNSGTLKEEPQRAIPTRATVAAIRPTVRNLREELRLMTSGMHSRLMNSRTLKEEPRGVVRTR